MKEIEDYYQIVGTNREAVKIDIFTHTERSEEEKNAFIKEKYEHTIKLVQIKKKNKSPEELEDELKRIEEAYDAIKDASSRYLYDKQVDERKEAEKRKKKLLVCQKKKQHMTY